MQKLLWMSLWSRFDNIFPFGLKRSCQLAQKNESVQVVYKLHSFKLTQKCFLSSIFKGILSYAFFKEFQIELEAQRECDVKTDDVIISTTTFSSNMFYIQWMTNMSLWRSGLQIKIYLISTLNAKLQIRFKYFWH